MVINTLHILLSLLEFVLQFQYSRHFAVVLVKGFRNFFKAKSRVHPPSCFIIIRITQPGKFCLSAWAGADAITPFAEKTSLAMVDKRGFFLGKGTPF